MLSSKSGTLDSIANSDNESVVKRAMKIKNKRIFITGGAGFIGTHLVNRLIENNEVIVYDTLERNALKNTGLLEHPNLKLVKGDVLDASKLSNAISGSNIVVHLAAVAGVDNVIRNPVKTMSVNLVGTYNVLQACADSNKLERFVYASTSEVFGGRAYNVDESHETSQGSVGEARWTYAVSKLAGEHLCHSYYKKFGMPGIIVRPFNVYGPGQVGTGAIHAFVIRAVKNQDLIIYGDGSQIRSWCYIDDLVDGLYLCLGNNGIFGHAFNIGDPRSTITVYDLAKRVLSLSGAASKIRFKKRTYVDIEIRVPNIDKARTMLGFQPRVDLDEGIRRTLDWYREKIT
jgi:UDP-glucuronate decarboxylase